MNECKRLWTIAVPVEAPRPLFFGTSATNVYKVNEVFHARFPLGNIISELPTLAASQPPNTVSRNRLSTQSYLRRVANILSNMDVVAPQKVHLELITKAAFDAQVVFFTAAMFHPDSADLDHFFDEFVRLCARPALAP